MNDYKRHFKLEEMATVDTFNGWKVIVYPSGSEKNPMGGRVEHGPPHFTFESINGENGVRVKIPHRLPSFLSDLSVFENDPVLPRKDMLKLFEWILDFDLVEDSDTGRTFRIRNYIQLIRQWNKENPNLQITVVKDKEGTVVSRLWNGQNAW